MEKQLPFNEEENKYINKLSYNEKSEFVDPADFTNVKQLENHILAESLIRGSDNIDKVTLQAAELEKDS